MNQLYKFYNKKATLIRGIMVANCPWMEDNGEETMTDDGGPGIASSSSATMQGEDDVKRAGNPLSHPKLAQPGPSSPIASCSSDIDMPHCRPTSDGTRSIQYCDDFRKEFDDYSTDDRLDDDNDNDDDEDSQMCKWLAAYLANKLSVINDNSLAGVNDVDDDAEYEEDDDLENLCPKYLIFSTGSKTYTPHQVGFKRIRNVNFPKKLDPGPSLRERIAAKERERVLQV